MKDVDNKLLDDSMSTVQKVTMVQSLFRMNQSKQQYHARVKKEERQSFPRSTRGEDPAKMAQGKSSKNDDNKQKKVYTPAEVTDEPEEGTAGQGKSSGCPCSNESFGKEVGPPDINIDDDATEIRDVTNARGGATEDDGRDSDVIIGSEIQNIIIARNGAADDGGENHDVINGSYIQKLFEQDEQRFHQKKEEMNAAFEDYDNGTAKWKEGIDLMIELESARWENVIDFMIELELSYYKPRNEISEDDNETEEDVGNVSSLT